MSATLPPASADNWLALQNEINQFGSITLTADQYITRTLTLVNGQFIDLNGHQLIYGGNAQAVVTGGSRVASRICNGMINCYKASTGISVTGNSFYAENVQIGDDAWAKSVGLGWEMETGLWIAASSSVTSQMTVRDVYCKNYSVTGYNQYSNDVVVSNLRCVSQAENGVLPVAPMIIGNSIQASNLYAWGDHKYGITICGSNVNIQGLFSESSKSYQVGLCGSNMSIIGGHVFLSPPTFATGDWTNAYGFQIGFDNTGGEMPFPSLSANSNGGWLAFATIKDIMIGVPHTTTGQPDLTFAKGTVHFGTNQTKNHLELQINSDKQEIFGTLADSTAVIASAYGVATAAKLW